MINFWKLTYKLVKEQRDELQLQNIGLKKELNYRNKSYTELFEAYEKLEREIEDINKHEDGLVSTIKLKDELLKESGEKIAELERENEKLKDKLKD